MLRGKLEHETNKLLLIVLYHLPRKHRRSNEQQFLAHAAQCSLTLSAGREKHFFGSVGAKSSRHPSTAAAAEEARKTMLKISPNWNPRHYFSSFVLRPPNERASPRMTQIWPHKQNTKMRARNYLPGWAQSAEAISSPTLRCPVSSRGGAEENEGNQEAADKQAGPLKHA